MGEHDSLYWFFFAVVKSTNVIFCMKFMVSGNKVSSVCAGSLVTETIRLKSGFLGHIAASSKLIRSGSL